MTTPLTSKTWAELAASKASVVPIPIPAPLKEAPPSAPVSKASLSDNWRATPTTTTMGSKEEAVLNGSSDAGDGWTVQKEDRKTKSSANKSNRTGQNHRSSSSSSTKSSASNTKKDNGNSSSSSTLNKVVESVPTSSASLKKPSPTTTTTTSGSNGPARQLSTNWASASAEDELPSPNFAPTVIPTSSSNGTGNVPIEEIQNILLPPPTTSTTLPPPPSTPSSHPPNSSLHSSASSSIPSEPASSIPTTSISSAASTTSSEIPSSTPALTPLTTTSTGVASDSWRTPEKVLVTAPIPKVNVWKVRTEQMAMAHAATAAPQVAPSGGAANGGAGGGASKSGAGKGGKGGNGGPKEEKEKKPNSTAHHPEPTPTPSVTLPQTPSSTIPKSTGASNPTPSSSTPAQNGTKVPASANPRRSDGWSGITPAAGSTTSGLSSQWPAPEEVVVAGGKKKGKKGANAAKEVVNGVSVAEVKTTPTAVEDEGFEELKGKRKSDKTKWIPIKVDITVARTAAVRGAHGASSASGGGALGEKRVKGGSRRESGSSATGGAALSKSPSNSSATVPLPNGVPAAGAKAAGEKKVGQHTRRNSNTPSAPVAPSAKATPPTPSSNKSTSASSRTDFPLPSKPTSLPPSIPHPARAAKSTGSNAPLPASLQNLDGSYPMKIEAPAIPSLGRPTTSRLAPEATALGRHAFNDLKSNKGPTPPSVPVVPATAAVDDASATPSSLPSTSAYLPSQPHPQFPVNPTSHHPSSTGYPNSFRNSAPRGTGIRGGSSLRGRGGMNRQVIQQQQQQHQQQQQMMYPSNTPYVPSAAPPSGPFDPNLVSTDPNGVPYVYGAAPGVVDPYYPQQQQAGMGMAPYFLNQPPYQQQQQGPVDPYTLDATRYWLLGQLEWYMSVDNLVRDTFLRSKMDDHGWIEISVIASFNRIKSLTMDEALVRETMTLTPVLEVYGSYVRLRQDWPKWLLPTSPPSKINAEFEVEQAKQEAETARIAAMGLNPIFVQAAAAGMAREFLPAGNGGIVAQVPVVEEGTEIVAEVEASQKGEGAEKIVPSSDSQDAATPTA